MKTFLKLVMVWGFVAGSLAAQQRFIVRAPIGQFALRTVCSIVGCNVLGGLGDPANEVFLISVLNVLNLGTILASLQLAGVTNIEPDQIARVALDARSIPDSLYRSDLVTWFGASTRYGYVFQPATQIIRITDAQINFDVKGSGIVAVIDTGVDPDHPSLRGILLPGYDFTRNVEGSASEKADVTQSTAAVVDGTNPFFVNENIAALLDGLIPSLFGDQTHSAFGHGTMVAGVVHLVAPRALILPLKAFKPDGTGYASDIVRALYYATRRGARVANMSFSMPLPSTELKRAIERANSSGTICVAAAGNDGVSSPRYPAAYPNVISVASTTNVDSRSSFSNYGSNWIWLAAPGEGIVTTYPYGTFAAGWGTSFSAPFVSGTVALLLETMPGLNLQNASSGVAQARPLTPELGHGRLDIYRAVQSLRSFQ
jgi:hypothetical protein